MRKLTMMGLLLLVVYVLSAADIFLAGDSTCSNYATNSPRIGWGQVFANFCKPEVKVFNHAVFGYSSRAFIEKGKRDKLMSQVKPGDYVIIQFGHND